MMFLMGDILSPIQLKRISDHKYSSFGRTFMDPIVQPFWNWLVLKLPLWLSPNLMTISGLLVNIFTSVILVCYSPDAKQEAPPWAFVLCAVGVFVYQTLDACDGKQARRTGSNSPLGELFDHGCDALSTVFVALGVCIAVQLGTFPSWMFFQCFMAMGLFYIAHWQTYVTGTLRFGRFDVTEAQFTVMLIYLISAAFGTRFWSTKIPSLHIELKLIPVFMGLVAASCTLYSNFTLIFTGDVGKNGSTVAGTRILSPFIPLALVIVPAFIIYQKSVTNVYENHPCVYILAFGMVACKITDKLVVAHMSKSEIDYLDSAFIGPGMLFLNQYFNTFLNEYVILWLCLVFSFVNLHYYCIIVCRQICSHLQIQLFKIVPQSLSDECAETDYHQLIDPLLEDESSETELFSKVQSSSCQYSVLEDSTFRSDPKLDDIP